MGLKVQELGDQPELDMEVAIDVDEIGELVTELRLEGKEEVEVWGSLGPPATCPSGRIPLASEGTAEEKADMVGT